MSYTNIEAVPDFNEYEANDYTDISKSLVGETARVSILNVEFLIALLIFFLIISIIGLGIYLLSKR